MLHKIETLISIGRYRNYTAGGQVAFAKVTLLYGDNGGGKTTLTAIIRSLTSNQPDLVLNRKSTSASANQAAQILQRSATGIITHTFHHTRGWTAPFPNIEIFDIHFINDNIFSGFEFNEDQKRQLHQFVIGATGVAVRQQIEQNKLDKSACRQLQNSLESQIILQVGNGLTPPMLAGFLTMPSPAGTNIDQEISDARAALNTANSNAVIRTLQYLTTFPGVSSPFDFAALETVLQSTSETIQNAALQSLFDHHCGELARHGMSNAENWLQTGFSYITRRNPTLDFALPNEVQCPLCQQPIATGNEIITAYAAKFDAAFNTMVRQVQGFMVSLQAFNMDAILQNLNNNDTNNRARIAAWAAHLITTVPQPNFTPLDEPTIRVEYQAALSAMRQKLQNPSSTVDITSVTAFKERLAAVRTNLTVYNQQVTAYNAAIAAFLGRIQTAVQAQERLDDRVRAKRRFTPAIATLCTQLAAERLHLTTLESQYSHLVQQEETAAQAFLTNYSTQINHYLGQVFKTPFRIENVTHVRPQGRAIQSKMSYKLTINGQDISFEGNRPLSAKNCLSEGDKSTIALALFLSKLDIDPHLPDKIIVFDDPLSSFDSNRRLYTVQLLKNLVPRIKQLVVLSHNEFFLFDIYKGFTAGDKVVLRISTDFVADASKIEPLNIEKLVENDYFKHIKELEQFLRSPDITKKDLVLGWLRNVLEGHLRFKFFRQLTALQPNELTFGRIISELVSQGVPFRDNTNRVAIIQKLWIVNGVSCRPHHGEPQPNYATLGHDPSSMTVSELVNLIGDTFRLIDVEL